MKVSRFLVLITMITIAVLTGTAGFYLRGSIEPVNVPIQSLIIEKLLNYKLGDEQ